MKEVITSIIIVIIIVSFDVITQNYTVNVVADITNELENLKSKISNNIAQEELMNLSKNIEEKWKEKNDKMAYYIEHDELEKVANNITSMISYLETKEYNFALNEIETNMFILDHIKDKYQLNLENIF